MKKKDKIFDTPMDIIPPFEFNSDVAEVFDDMAGRSIPFYHEVIRMTGEIVEKFLPRGTTIYDLGCSTCSTLIYLSKVLKGRDAGFVGIDSSQAMVDEALHKIHRYRYSHKIDVHQGDILKHNYSNAGAFVLNYTLQFLPPDERPAFIKKLHNELCPGGIILISEKTGFADDEIHGNITELYLDFKKRNGYSELEIAQKRAALEDRLIPLTLKENIDMLKDAGYKRIVPFFKWYNFVSIFAIKD